MNRIDSKFRELAAKSEKALITFVTVGDPDIEITKQLVLAMEQAGADIIEIGIPFSDPVAEGPVIQAASERALKNRYKTDEYFEMVKELRRKTDLPLLFMMYLNCIYVYGKERFFDRCRECGIDGVIVPDLPYEEREEITDIARGRGVYSINLVAPTSKERIQRIAADSKGFLYCVSSLGVTGPRDKFDTDFDQFFGQINQNKTVPTCIGFGVSSPKQVKELKKYCDGVIVASAIVRIVGEFGRDSVPAVGEFVKSLKAAALE